MQTTSSVLNVALIVQRRTCVAEDDEGLGRSKFWSPVVAKIKLNNNMEGSGSVTIK